jgi:molybdopterin synthase catalytic subunit
MWLMNKIKVLLFATLRDYVGARSVEFEVPGGSTVAALEDELVRRYPRLEKVRGSMMAAINREFAADEMVIPENAEVAFFPPVSGG